MFFGRPQPCRFLYKARTRIHLLRTMCEMGRAASAADICSRANAECSVDEDDPRLAEIDALPLISPQGITAKLGALRDAGLVVSQGMPWTATLEWLVTPKGRELAYEPGSD